VLLGSRFADFGCFLPNGLMVPDLSVRSWLDSGLDGIWLRYHSAGSVSGFCDKGLDELG
jgi:hypothetical protein